jgi:LacI family transcriptional regulator
LGSYGRPPTIADVARAAGVSPATVSRVLNGHGTVDPTLAKKVRATTAKLGYVPNAIARGLALGTSHAVGVVVPDLANPFFPTMLKGIGLAAGTAGFRIVVAESNERIAEEVRLADELARLTDGLILCSPRMPTAALRSLVERGVPVVATNRVVRATELGIVAADWMTGARELASHLAQLGHRKIVFMAGPPSSWSNQQRRHALARFGNGMQVETVAAGSTSADGYAALPAALETGATAIVAFNDLVALGVLGRLGELGVRVPDDISVAGFDDIPSAGFLRPPLTSVRLPLVDLGMQAWHVLQRRLNKQPPGPPVRLLPELVIRESTAPPAKAPRRS